MGNMFARQGFAYLRYVCDTVLFSGLFHQPFRKIYETSL